MTDYSGCIVNLFLKSKRGSVMTERSQLRIVAGYGIDRDIHAHSISPRQVLVVRQEDLVQLDIDPGELSENIVISGANLDRFAPGSVLKFPSGAAIRLTFHCEPCKRVAHLVKSLKSIESKRGILGVAIADGVVTSGDRVEIQPEVFPALSDVPYERFLEFLTKIPVGKVVTYQQVIIGIGVSAGYFRAMPKYLQTALKEGYPVHRVLNSQGYLTAHITNQRERLEAEGVRVIDRSTRDDKQVPSGSFVALDDYLWSDPTIYLT
jgi:alkylated DNA nucleotide flippase Atl1